MIRLSIQNSYGPYLAVGLSGGTLARRKQFFQIYSNHANSRCDLMELGTNFSYFLINSLEEFRKVLAAARLGILISRNGYEETAAMQSDAEQTAAEIVDEAEICRFLTTPQETSCFPYKIMQNLNTNEY